jgi:hypothetical protein
MVTSVARPAEHLHEVKVRFGGASSEHPTKHNQTKKKKSQGGFSEAKEKKQEVYHQERTLLSPLYESNEIKRTKKRNNFPMFHDRRYACLCVVRTHVSTSSLLDSCLGSLALQEPAQGKAITKC